MDSAILTGVDLLHPDSLEVGTYVVISVDPVVSLQTVQDSFADLAAQQFHPGKYVGLVSRIWTRDDAEYPLKIEVFLVGQGMPTETPDTVVDPSMSTPIFPTTEHPSGRGPVRPSKPLPWSNCYQHSFMNMTLVVSSIDRRNASGMILPKADILRHGQNTEVDREKEKLLVRLWERAEAKNAFDAGMHSGSCSDAVGENTLQLESKLPLDIPQDLDSDNASEYKCLPMSRSKVPLRAPGGSDITRLDFDPESFVDSPPFHIMDFLSLYSAELTCKLSLDLSLVRELPNPRNFFKEVDQIYSIEREADERWNETHEFRKKELRITSWLHDTQYETNELPLPPFSPIYGELPSSPAAFVDPARLTVDSKLPHCCSEDDSDESLSGSTQYCSSDEPYSTKPPSIQSKLVFSVKHRLRALSNVFQRPRQSLIFRLSASKT